MKRFIAATFCLAAACLVSTSGRAQDAAPTGTPDAVGQIVTKEISPESLALATQLVTLTGTNRTFDEVLPSIAEQAKNAFIRANPQMQLGIIEVVDRMALTLVGRRPELDQALARVWASGFTDAEMQDLVDFYSTETGKKYAQTLPQVLAIQMEVAQRWGRAVNAELTQKVTEELRSSMAAEQRVLQGDIAAPAPDGAAPAAGEPAAAPAQ